MTTILWLVTAGYAIGAIWTWRHWLRYLMAHDEETPSTFEEWNLGLFFFIGGIMLIGSIGLWPVVMPWLLAKEIDTKFELPYRLLIGESRADKKKRKALEV